MEPLFLGVISVSWVYIGHIDLYMRFTLYKVTLGLFWPLYTILVYKCGTGTVKYGTEWPKSPL